MIKFKAVMLRKDVFDNYSIIEKLYRKYHPEFDGVPLSRTKLTLEMQKIYVKGHKETELIQNYDEAKQN